MALYLAWKVLSLIMLGRFQTIQFWEGKKVHGHQVNNQSTNELNYLRPLFNSIQINNLKWCHNKERGTFVCQAIIISNLSTFTFHQYILIFVWSYCVIGIHYFLFLLIIRSKFYEVSICQSIGPPALRFWLLWRGCTL